MSRESFERWTKVYDEVTLGARREAAIEMRESAARACIDVVLKDFPTGGMVENVVAYVCKHALERIMALPLPGDQNT